MEGYIFRTLQEMGATPADFVIILMGLFFAGIVYFTASAHSKLDDTTSALIKEHNETHHRERQLESKLARDSLAAAVSMLDDRIKVIDHAHGKQRQLESKLSRDALAEAIALIDNRLKGLDERYHRQDALQYGTAKVVEAKTGVKLINDSADGDGNFTLDRGIG